jgi:hypothetical protein
MNTAQVLQFPARAVARVPETLARVVLMHRGETFDYDSPEQMEAEFQAMLIREGWTPPPQAVADAPSPPQAEPEPEPPPEDGGVDAITEYYRDRNRSGWAAPRHRTAAQARAWPPMHDVLIVGLGLTAVLLALAAGL